MPRAQGGESRWDNCVLACLTCNHHKANRTPQRAKLRLRKQPVRPKWNPPGTEALLWSTAHEVRMESWSKFIYEAVMESKAELSPWMSWCHANYSRQDAATWVEGRPSAWERGENWSFVIVDSSGRLLGTCGFHRLDSLHGVGELGYWVRSSLTGLGIATEATRNLCQWAFAEKGLHRVEIIMSMENIASQRVAEKAGAVREGVLRQRLLLNGRRHDAALFAVLND
ncbi:MAG: GNAT family N-acetyltransferase [Planctomycetota bacterium]|nr:GNAT family N-acetyltransferase [Planctomycetota bacterium]